MPRHIEPEVIHTEHWKLDGVAFAATQSNKRRRVSSSTRRHRDSVAESDSASQSSSSTSTSSSPASSVQDAPSPGQPSRYEDMPAPEPSQFDTTVPMSALLLNHIRVTERERVDLLGADPSPQPQQRAPKKARLQPYRSEQEQRDFESWVWGIHDNFDTYNQVASSSVARDPLPTSRSSDELD